MKRGGLALAIVVAITGFLRMTGSSATGPTSRSTDIANQARAALSSSEDVYPTLLTSKIREFYGSPGPADAAHADPHWGVPPDAGAGIRFVIALVPDPVHTHLGLLFDRSVEALQQAAQHQSYTFDRAVLPWVETTPVVSFDAKSRESEQKDQ